MKLLIRLAGALVLTVPAIAGGGLALAGPAQAATTTVSLQGEFLSSLPPAQTTSGVCNPDGSGTATFTVSGPATGGYTGTFTETGAATWGPTLPGTTRSELTSFSADFTISSPLGEVTGHKELPADASHTAEVGNAAACLNSFEGVITQIASNRLTYTASTPFGDDSGTTFVNMNSYPNPTVNSSSLQFREGFSSPNPVNPPPPPGPASVTLSPASATNPVGTDHTVTATVRNSATDPVSGARVLFSVTGASSTTGSCTTGANGQCDFTYHGPSSPGTDSITGCADSNTSGTADPGEPCGTATKEWVGPSSVTLTPPDAVNPVGTSHTVTATATFPSGATASGFPVLLNVQGATTTSGSCTTDSNGQCSFSYQGPDLPGADQITACVDTNRNGHADSGEPCTTATKAWVLPSTTYGQVTGGGQVANASGSDNIAFGFNAKSDSKGVKGECNLVDPSTSTKIKCLDVTTVVSSGTHATLFGHATVNGTATSYRIDVDDLGEPGKGKDTFKIHTDSGYTAGGVLTGGNIQVH